MARKSPPLVNQKCDIGCSSQMFRIFNFGESHSDGRFVSNSKHFNKKASGSGKSRISSDVLTTVDEKYPHVDVSSRRRSYSCKSICMENDPKIADWENEVTKMIVNQRFFNKNCQGKDGVDCEPNQFLDAVQILYSNKELFVKLLQDPNSLLVKQIHDLHSSQQKAGQTGNTRLNKAQNSSARQHIKHFKDFDGYNMSSNSESQSSKRIVVLKPGTNSVKKFADTSSSCPQPHSSNSFSYNAQNNKPSHFSLGSIKRKLRHVMRVRRIDSVPSEFHCGSEDFEDGKNVKELDISERDLSINVHVSTGKSLKAFKLKDSELSVRQEAASFEESCSSAQKIKEPPVATFLDELQVFCAADISLNKSHPGENLQEHYDIPKDLIRSSLYPMNKLLSSKDIIREVLHGFSLKCDDELMRSHLSNLLMDSSTFEGLNGLTSQLSESTTLNDCIIECFMELSTNPNFQACVVRKVLVREIHELISLHFSPHPSSITLLQLVEKDFARRGSWLNIQVDIEEIVKEVEKDVLEKLVLEIVDEIDIRYVIQCNETMSRS
ncbi:uncharacterized protein [Cicer arietinum]|uniref:Uncharacterized protein LOC101497539 isoform X2 n=1 Tax=Cicer arietinum TaxID=3827 RepID=A0A1S2YFH8_CICAR|nr:uncharacterized protein LOC101497539 isoform X2 [Cicer arietinum]